MDLDLMLQWIEHAWKPSVTCLKVSYILLDCWTSHLTTAVKEVFENCNTELDLIPKGNTSKLQPMDVGINKPFKNSTSHQFSHWLVANILVNYIQIAFLL
jgi:DDE superfamily endonuclease